ncbi:MULTISPECIES: hypothetical protein [unclassified Leptolyngbya]|uniref:hypothetical protein n=1 Tax=unclassified Leptolyngbya TaxID=2650499 RepID=UPI001ACF6F36|nr:MULTISPECIES: hypothetical protein [unclassified Leptolyngbya]MBN8561631.1 hypothetical protein [Leptolyngbya sp. UWPOB_LEPTO1]MCY6492968.1 hypothetical protein [Leptolyngbya sp. GGD]
MKKLKFQPAAEILLLLLLTDFLSILAHFALRLSPQINSTYWTITTDRGFGETFQYVKEFWLFCSFAILASSRAEWSYLSFSLLFGYLLIDDAFLVHERVGEWIATTQNFQPVLGLRAIDLGELVVAASTGLVFLLLIGVSYWLGTQQFRWICKRLFVLLGCLAFFGVVVDALHIMIEVINRPGIPLGFAFELAEDGGEMIVMSLLCWYGISLLKQPSLSPVRTDKVVVSSSRSN